MDLSDVANWLSSSSQVEALKPYIELVESLAITFAAGIAMWGINSWRREFLFRKEYELAEEVLPLFYKAPDLIRGIRNPLRGAEEGQTRKPAENEHPA